MRGLTSEEYALLRLAAHADCERFCTPDEEQTVRVLILHGRVVLESSNWILGAHRVVATPAGLEAMRLHEALAAWVAS